MSAQDTADNPGGDSGDAAKQTQQAAEQSDSVGSYSPEKFPEDPGAADSPLDEGATEPPKSD